jgi:hypothetical protein
MVDRQCIAESSGTAHWSSIRNLLESVPAPGCVYFGTTAKP